ncbi:DJ-1/PfpI family protein [Sphaerisporangium sp. TRM90804]|uniref:DJ-1/PfpI family protein n=1 Tax=Sphaerisporangium sp. TRM90804 TaxID=3031113 RepID=UPI00244A5C82|nr:DJ-1/PfpI family protein [Sphaerisporangium sp. TRM90804]MDH2425920.1 DJ-1/PfpI family protein [Sphaerisporangium sp. TRM90804]
MASTPAPEPGAAPVKTIAFVLYPGITALDMVGPLQVFSALAGLDPSVRPVVVSGSLEALGTDTPLSLTASHTFDQVRDPYAVIVPGGTEPTFTAMADEDLLAWLRDVAGRAEIMASVCTGSLILGAAGLLEGRQATTHWACRPLLSRLGATPVRRRWVQDGPVVTAAGVSAGIDLALHLAERLSGRQTAQFVQLLIEYDPEPPHGPIDWSTVGPADAWVDSMVQKGLAGHPGLIARLTG